MAQKISADELHQKVLMLEKETDDAAMKGAISDAFNRISLGS